MIIQYDDIVLQVVDRLKAVIPQGSIGPPAVPKVADVKPMVNAQKDFDDFLNSAEQSKILVTYSGNTAEGYKRLESYVATLDEVTQMLVHTIEIHICCKKYMKDPIDTTPNTMLRLMWAVRAALTGLRMYERDNSGVVQYDEMHQVTNGMFLVESFVDQSYPGVVTVMRFQVMEIVTQELANAADIWGIYKEITLQEYSQGNGEESNISGDPTDVVVVKKDT